MIAWYDTGLLIYEYHKSSINSRGGYLKLKILGALLNGGRHLLEGGAFSKTIFLTC